MSLTATPVRISLHPAQARFLDSQAPFRGFVGGRGAGKTFVGAYDLLKRARPGRLYMVVAPTYTMLRDACLRTFLSLTEQLRYLRDLNRSDLRARLGNGAEVLFRSADEPDRLRGANLSGVWLDEASVMAQAAFDVVIACLREGGEQGWLSATFTPKGQTHWTYKVFGGERPDVLLVRAGTRENPFLPPQFADTIARQYTAFMARQELEGSFIGDVPGALWKRPLVDATRLTEHPPLTRVVVAIDPAVTSAEGADETGIVVAGLGTDGQGYVLADETLQASPHAWASAAITAYHAHKADRIVAEVNNGGEMVELTLRTVDPNVPYRAVHASRGKRTRAEPIAALYEQGRVHHVGDLSALEDQMTTWTPEDRDSPDRMDALVWALTELMLGHTGWARGPAQ